MIAASTAIKWRIIMKLVSFAASGRNSYGAVVGDGVFDLGRRLGDRYPTLRAAIAGDALGAAAAEVKSGAPDIALSQVTLLPPITDPDKIICAGRNYRAHAAEAGGAPPENPAAPPCGGRSAQIVPAGMPLTAMAEDLTHGAADHLGSSRFSAEPVFSVAGSSDICSLQRRVCEPLYWKISGSPVASAAGAR